MPGAGRLEANTWVVEGNARCAGCPVKCRVHRDCSKLGGWRGR